VGHEKGRYSIPLLRTLRCLACFELGKVRLRLVRSSLELAAKVPNQY
jgi:hypothetical protein